MCNVNEQIERKKKDVEPTLRKPIATSTYNTKKGLMLNKC